MPETRSTGCDDGGAPVSDEWRQSLTAVTSEAIRAVDRVAVEEIALELLQMLENAGRNLAAAVGKQGDAAGGTVVLAGDGGPV